jgi:putative two-component system response regulator
MTAHVLVVDDVEANRELLASQLEQIGCEVEMVADGYSALRAVEAGRTDLVLLDVSMPGVSGLEVCRTLKSQAATRMLPIVLVTGQTELEDRVRGLKAGADDVLHKPVALAELEARLDSLLEAKQTTDQMEAAEQVIASLAGALDARSPYTMEHSTRVAVLAEALGSAAGLSGEDLEDLYQGGLVHDVGKIGLPDSILAEAGPLDAQMQALVREHPVVGERIIAPLRSAQRLAPMVRHHHERYDGQGYPDRLAGDQIPLRARILAVCDAFDAMVSDRPYRPAMTLEAAATALAEGSGEQWDPMLVHLFINYVIRDASGARLGFEALPTAGEAA